MVQDTEEARPRITSLLVSWSEGNDEALHELMPLVYDELQILASSYLRRERQGHTLPTSALVHETFLRLSGQESIPWQSRRHFFGIAARTMRRILVEHARQKLRRADRGSSRLSLDTALEIGWMQPQDLVALDDALHDLARLAPEQAQIVELRFFAGLKAREIAEVLLISVPTVTRRWRVARAWLYRALAHQECHDS